MFSPEERRQKAAQMLEGIKDMPSSGKPDRFQQAVNGEFHWCYNIAAIRQLCTATVAADDATLLATKDMTIEQVFDWFVFFN
jgi:hypothetical protein